MRKLAVWGKERLYSTVSLWLQSRAAPGPGLSLSLYLDLTLCAADFQLHHRAILPPSLSALLLSLQHLWWSEILTAVV